MKQDTSQTNKILESIANQIDGTPQADRTPAEVIMDKARRTKAAAEFANRNFTR